MRTNGTHLLTLALSVAVFGTSIASARTGTGPGAGTANGSAIDPRIEMAPTLTPVLFKPESGAACTPAAREPLSPFQPFDQPPPRKPRSACT